MANEHRISSLDELYPYITKKIVVEIGCGHGEHLLLFAGHADKVIGYEGDEKAYEIAIENVKHLDNVALINSYVKPSRMIPADVYYLQQVSRWGRRPEYINDFSKKVIESNLKGLFAIPEENESVLLKDFRETILK